MLRSLATAAGVLVTTIGLSVGTLVSFTEPASAACILSGETLAPVTSVLGTCDGTGNCAVNLGICDTGGSCRINIGWCNGGACDINIGYCGAGGTCPVNIGICGASKVGAPTGNGLPSANNACFGTGQAVLGNGIAYPPNYSTNVPFTFTFNCAGTGGTISGSGVLTTAACGRSVGTGVIAGVGDFSLETAGSMLVVTGYATGGGNATPIPNTSTIPPTNSCSNGTATTFALVGGLVW
jgi:hypothetical protein